MIPLSGPPYEEEDAVGRLPPVVDPSGEFEEEGGPDYIDGQEDVTDFI